MKKTIFLLCGLMAAVLSSSAAEGRVFALATAGDLEPGFTARVVDYLEAQTGAVLRRTDPVAADAAESLEEIGRTAARALREDEVGVLVLGRFGDGQPQGVCLPHERFGILNLSRLEAGADADRLVRRTGQDGLRVLAMLVGMSACPFPLCVLTGYEQTEDLDRMSGNFCPPCRDRFERLAREAGLLMKPAAPDAEAPAEAETSDAPAADDAPAVD